MTSLNFFRNPLRGLFGGKDRPTVPVKELRERDRRRMLKHFLTLERHDRLLRFGSPVNDEQIARYVGGIDFDRDLVFGVYNRVFKLVAVGHLAFAERDADKHKVTAKDQVAEFGVSVSKSARGLGIGSRLVEECLTFARRAGYRRMVLWTQSILTSAHRIYEAQGFVLGEEEPHHSFGVDLVGQFWHLEL